MRDTQGQAHGRGGQREQLIKVLKMCIVIIQESEGRSAL